MDGHVAQCPCCGGEGASFGRFRVLAAQLGAGAAQAAQPPAAAPGEHHRCLPSKPPTMARAAASWDRWERLKARIDAGELILMDGGTGTEVERRVKEMGDPTAVDDSGWSCAQVSEPLALDSCRHTDTDPWWWRRRSCIPTSARRCMQTTLA